MGPPEFVTSAASIRASPRTICAIWRSGGSSGPRERRATARFYSFADLSTIKQVASELERDAAARPLRALWPSARVSSRSISTRRLTRPAPRSSRCRRARPKTPQIGAAVPLPASAGSPVSLPDPQAALAAKYFIEGSRLDDGDERKMEEAAAAYRKALVIDPDLVPAIVNLANIHYARDELIEAQALYERAIGLDPDCFEAHFNLGNIHHDLGRYDVSAGAATATRWRSTRPTPTRTSTSR